MNTPIKGTASKTVGKNNGTIATTTGSNGCPTGSNVANNGHNGFELFIINGCRMAEQRVEQRLSLVVQWQVLEMSNSHAIANFAVVTGSNRIPFLFTKPLHYVNPFFLEDNTVAKKAVLFFAKTAAIPSGNGWSLVINGSYNGWQWKLHRKWVQWPFPFR